MIKEITGHVAGVDAIFDNLQILIMKEKKTTISPAGAVNPTTTTKRRLLMMVLPIIAAVLLPFVPVLDGLPPYAWHYFAISIGVIVGLTSEPLPGAVIDITDVVVITLCSQWLLFSPEQMVVLSFELAGAPFKQAVGGSGNFVVWFIFGVFMFVVGHNKIQSGRRLALIPVKYLGRRSLTLGYVITFADLLLVLFTPPNTARNGSTIYPIITNLPPLYGSKPNDPNVRKVGPYLMWMVITATCITSSMFLSASAPNLLVLALVKSIVDTNISWGTWFTAFLPFGVLLILTTPLLVYWFYPLEVEINNEVPPWAARELEKLGKLSRNEILPLVLACFTLMMWIFATDWIGPALAALLVTVLILWTGVLSWSDITNNKAAWNTLVWFATLVALTDGFSSTGFIAWLGKEGGALIGGIPPGATTIVPSLAFYLLHYLFASTTAHTTALLPAMLTIATTIPGMNMEVFALLMVTSLGVMGIITPYGTGPSPAYYGSGYLPTEDYWRLGTIFGTIFLAVLLLTGYPWMSMVL